MSVHVFKQRQRRANAGHSRGRPAQAHERRGGTDLKPGGLKITRLSGTLAARRRPRGPACRRSVALDRKVDLLAGERPRRWTAEVIGPQKAKQGRRLKNGTARRALGWQGEH